ncbi:hypothetical protein E2I00_007125 [Balaenoptera physalus]|uniref:Ras-GEF domain-containing protein n=1 Tax=Balaenoptera physalus TaxID=9770 RepID=A0A6A1QIY6_BALPH|nr:hypothetical protein E2I00_007125 [Balaenoptera physalus]
MEERGTFSLAAALLYGMAFPDDGTDVVGSMDLMNGQASSVNIAATASEKSSSSESLSDKGSELKKSFDAVVFDVLKVTPEEYAGQITLMDVPVFKAIQPDVSFWVVREILHAQTLKIRAEVLSHYIKTAKLLSRKDKTTFEKLEYVMSKEDNYKRLRDYISSLKMTPCIPYLEFFPSHIKLGPVQIDAKNVNIYKMLYI